MSNKFTLLLFLYYIKYIITQNSDFKCGRILHNLKIGDDVILCIHILSKEPKKFAIPIKIDEYSVVSFNQIYKFIKPENNHIEENNNPIELIAQIGDKLTIMPTVSIQY